MKVLGFAAAGAALFGVSKTDVTIAPDVHGVVQSCSEAASPAENPVTVLGAFVCELQDILPYDSLRCLLSRTRLSWDRPDAEAPKAAEQKTENSA